MTAPAKRRWFQFTLREWFLALTALSFGIAWYQERQPWPHRGQDYVTKFELRIIEQQGWVEAYNRGKEIRRKLLPNSGKVAEMLIQAYRDEYVVFTAAGAIPGGSNDLMSGDLYLRVFSRENKDLTPQAIMFEVLVRGKVRQVLPDFRIIDIEVDEEDWIVLETW